MTVTLAQGMGGLKQGDFSSLYNLLIYKVLGTAERVKEVKQ